jgi:hypothetical protein
MVEYAKEDISNPIPVSAKSYFDSNLGWIMEESDPPIKEVCK